MSWKVKGVIAFFVIAVLGVAGLVGYDRIRLMNHKVPAETTAKQYVKELGWEASGISCTNQDTDGDSYVSCTVGLKTGQEKHLLCVGTTSMFKFIKNTGCKIQKMPALVGGQ